MTNTDTKFDYTYDEVRNMLHWELTLNGNSHTEAIRLTEVLTDEILKMWEQAGATSRIDLQSRVESFRKATA